MTLIDLFYKSCARERRKTGHTYIQSLSGIYSNNAITYVRKKPLNYICSNPENLYSTILTRIHSALRIKLLCHAHIPAQPATAQGCSIIGIMSQLASKAQLSRNNIQHILTNTTRAWIALPWHRRPQAAVQAYTSSD